MKTLMTIVKQALGALLALAIMTPAIVSARPDIRIAMTAHRELIVEQQGQQVTKLAPIDFSTPGATLVYRMEYINAGDQPATGVVIESAVPRGTVYIAGTAWGEGSEIVFSVDGGKTYARPELLSYDTTPADGGKRQRTATPAQYTHIRWTVHQVNAGQRGDVGYRVSVVDMR